MASNNTIRPNAPTLPNRFDKTETKLREGATEAQAEAQVELQKADAALETGAAHVDDAFRSLDSAGDHAATAALQAADGAGHFLASAGFAADGVEHAVNSGLGKVAHLGKEAIQAVARAASRFCEKLTKALASIGGEDAVTTRSIRNTDDALKAFYELQGELAKQGFSKAGDEFSLGWKQWGEAMKSALQAGGDLGSAAVSLGQAGASVAEALAHTGIAGVAETEALVKNLSAIAVDAAQNGVIGAADLALVTSEFLAATANTISTPTHPKIEVTLQQQTELLRKSLVALCEQHPELQPRLSQL